MSQKRWELSLTDKNQRSAITQISGFFIVSPNGNHSRIILLPSYDILPVHHRLHQASLMYG